MKRNLLRTVYGCMLLLFTVQLLQGQIQGDPSFKAATAGEPVIEKSTGKLSPQLQQLFDKRSSAKASSSFRSAPAAVNDAMEELMTIKGNNVMVDITVKEGNKNARAELEKLGLKVSAAYGRVISGMIPIEALPALEKSTYIKHASPSYRPVHRNMPLNKGVPDKRLSPNEVKPVISQGDTAQRSYLARKYYNVDGKGVKVGILSDSYNNLGTAAVGVANGELPGPGNPFNFKKPVQVLKDLDDSSGIDEGRGMAEIIHDVAPGAEMAFYTAFISQADFAQGILQLAKVGCQVITDDVYYYAEPFFQDGIIAQAVDIVKSKGVAFFSAAGNDANYSYESDYRKSSVTPAPFPPEFGSAHNFSAPGTAPRYFQPIRLPTSQTVTVSFQWDQSFYSAGGTGAETDLDIYLLNSEGNIVAFGNSDNILSGDAVEVFRYTNFSAGDIFYIAILNYSGPDPSQLKYILYAAGDFVPTNPAIPGIYAPTLVGHPKAEGAIATGAAPFYTTPAYGVDTPKIEWFSALGGVPNYFDIEGNRIRPLVRKKPDITAPDNGNSSFFPPFPGYDIPEDSDILPNFPGTSAAAPHAAGVAALMIQAQKLQTITPGQIKGIMSASAVDMDNTFTPGFDKGFDYNTGAGLVKADEAVNAVRFPKIFVKDLKLASLCSDAPREFRRWKIINPNPFEVEVHWFITGGNQNGKLSVPPGESMYTTETAYSRNGPLANIAVIEWEDNFGFPHFDLSTSSTARCSKNSDIAESSADATENNIAAEITKPNTAEVYPNPSRTNFRVYLSLANQQNIDLELYSIDGKKLYKKTLQSNGIVDIDASGYKPGVYILRVKQGEFNKTIKLIRE